MTKTAFFRMIESTEGRDWNINDMAHQAFMERDGDWEHFYSKCRNWIGRMVKSRIILKLKTPSMYRVIDKDRFASRVRAEEDCVPGRDEPVRPPKETPHHRPPTTARADTGPAHEPLRLHDGKWTATINNSREDLRVLLDDKWSKTFANGKDNYVMRNVPIYGALCATLQIVAGHRPGTKAKLLVQWLPVVMSGRTAREKLDMIDEYGQILVTELAHHYALDIGLIEVLYDHHFALTLTKDAANRIRKSYVTGESGKLKCDSAWNIDQSYLDEIECYDAKTFFTLTDALQRFPHLEDALEQINTNYCGIARVITRLSDKTEALSENQLRLAESIDRLVDSQAKLTSTLRSMLGETGVEGNSNIHTHTCLKDDISYQ